jgi:hypothetical protein
VGWCNSNQCAAFCNRLGFVSFHCYAKEVGVYASSE